MPAIPMLTLGPIETLNDPADIAVYVLKFLFFNPGYVSSNNEEEMLSFRKLQAQYGKDPGELAIKVEGALSNVLARYVTDVILIPKVDTYEITNGLYGLSVAISDSANNLFIPRAKVEVIDENVPLLFFEREIATHGNFEPGNTSTT